MKHRIAAGIMALLGLVVVGCMARAAGELFGVWHDYGTGFVVAATVVGGLGWWLCFCGAILWAFETLRDGK